MGGGVAPRRRGVGVSVRAGARRHPVLAAVVAAYIVAWCAYGLFAGSGNTASYVVLVSAVALAVAAADAGVNFSLLVLVGLAIWGFGHLAGGLVALDGPGERILYNAVFLRWGHFDNVVHAIGFGTSGIAVWEATRSWLPAEPGHRLGTPSSSACWAKAWGPSTRSSSSGPPTCWRIPTSAATRTPAATWWPTCSAPRWPVGG